MKIPFRAFAALLRQEFLVICSAATPLCFRLFPPLIQIVAFGSALANDGKHMVPVGLNPDRPAASCPWVEKFVNPHRFRVVGWISWCARRFKLRSA